MAVRLLRRPKAVEDAEAIADFLAKDSVASALRFLENTEVTLRFLTKSPQLGGVFSSNHPEFDNLRVWRVKGFSNHIIFYFEHPDAIEVIRILHGARDIDAELGKT